MTESSDEPIDEATACGSSDGGQLASSASWPHDDEIDDGYDDLLASIGRTEEQDRRVARFGAHQGHLGQLEGQHGRALLPA